MIYQIDQSGKIEDTAKNTILCLSNGDWDAVFITAKTKRQLQEIFRRNGQIRNFIYFTFAAALSLLLERNDKIRQIFIDKEYTGHENTITNIVKNMFNSSTGLISLHWIFIGKKANAHNRAYAIGLGKLKAGKTISLKELLKAIKKTEVGTRLKDT